MKFNIRFGLAFAIMLIGLTSAMGADPVNSIYTDLTSKGVPLADGKNTAKLPTFVMDDGLNGAAQDAVINKLLTGPDAPSLTNFMKKSVSAPPIRVDTDIPESTSHQLDLYFIAYGNLQTVANGGFWKSRMGANKNGKMDFLKDADLQQRKLKVIDQPTIKERYAHADITLFEMVKVAATARAIETIGQESVVIAFMLDPSFQKDKDFPNEWRPVTFNKAGAKVVGNPSPYDGVGAYSKVTELKNTPGALFVEYHIIWDEPKGWFAGKPVMKSKLGTMIDNDVRSFRNDLKAGAAAAKPAPAAAAPVAPPAGNQPAAGAGKAKTDEKKDSK
jgi:hypothetical protein